MRRALRYSLIGLLALVVALPLTVIVILETGMADARLERLAVREIDQMTGGRAEIGSFHFRLRGLRVEMDDFTLHGREKSVIRPFFHADHILVRARLLSFWGKRVALDEVKVENPVIAVEVDASGQSNLPVPPVRHTTHPWREELFNLQIGHLALKNGQAIYNNQQVPISVIANEFHFAMAYQSAANGQDVYAGNLGMERAEIALRKDAPFRASIQSHFTLRRDGFSLDELQANLGQSEFHVRADLASLVNPVWQFHTRARLDLTDMARIFRKHNVPLGTVEWTGEGSYAAGRFAAEGHYQGRGIAFRNQWFHARGIQSWGRFSATQDELQLPEFAASVLGGSLTGRMNLVFNGWRFHTETKGTGISLAATMDAVNNRSLPIDPLDWNGRIAVTSVNEWSGGFDHFRTRGDSNWTAPKVLAAGQIPASAEVHFDYVNDNRTMTLTNSKIWTPDSTVVFQGTLARGYSRLQTDFSTRNLLEWDDFIDVLRGRDAEKIPIGGAVKWSGQILGPIVGPEFKGHVEVAGAKYGRLYWDELAGDLTYSPDELRFENVRAVRERSAAELSLSLSFDGSWGFVPESPWSLDARLQETPVEGLQEIFETSYPVTAQLSGQFHGGGTRAEPHLAGDFSADKIVARGMHFDQFTGHLDVEPGNFCVKQGRIEAGHGQINGRLCYSLEKKSTDFSVTGKGLALADLLAERRNAPGVAGRLEFQAEGHGALLAPVGSGEVHIQSLNVGGEKEGDLNARVTSDGQTLHAVVDSSISGELHGDLTVALGGDYPVAGRVDVRRADLDPLIESVLHLTAVTGHSSVDGSFVVSGGLRDSHSWKVEATISRLSLGYESVMLQNAGPIRLGYGGERVRIEQANLRGPNSDFRVEGEAHFAGDRSLNVHVEGTVDLRLVRAFAPQLETRGTAQMTANIGGTLEGPEITGQINVRDASAQFGEFPVGLNHVNGSLIFDGHQMVFSNVSAESGGGSLQLNGFIAYAARPVRFQISMTATSVRIRYPAGLSWLGSATLRLAGSSDAALLSGNVTADRLLLTTDTGLAGLLVAGSSATVAGAPTGSLFLRNLQFNITAQTTPGARMEWTGGQIDVEGTQRLRGTWDHPVLLGNVHVLAGSVNFQGTKYEISRGDINFANPFRLDPVINVEATTTIQQYVVTLDFAGPMSHLSVAYRADPPLPSSDIVALLAVGSTGQANALRSSSGQSQNYGATALLSAAISSQLGGRIEKLFGVSQFRVNPFLAGNTTEQNTAARVTVQRQVTHSLTVTYSSNATSNQQQVVEVEYAINPRVSIVGLRDINGIYSMNVKFKKRFK
jgi:translocation and assembly module TamB